MEWGMNGREVECEVLLNLRQTSHPESINWIGPSGSANKRLTTLHAVRTRNISGRFMAAFHGKNPSSNPHFFNFSFLLGHVAHVSLFAEFSESKLRLG